MFFLEAEGLDTDEYIPTVSPPACRRGSEEMVHSIFGIGKGKSFVTVIPLNMGWSADGIKILLETKKIRGCFSRADQWHNGLRGSRRPRAGRGN